MSTCRFERMLHLVRVIPSALEDVILKVSMFGLRSYPFTTQVCECCAWCSNQSKSGTACEALLLVPIYMIRPINTIRQMLKLLQLISFMHKSIPHVVPS